MNPKAIAVGLGLVGIFWIWLAFESYGRGKLGISAVQMLAAAAFVGRGVWEWRKAAD